MPLYRQSKSFQCPRPKFFERCFVATAAKYSAAMRAIATHFAMTAAFFLLSIASRVLFIDKLGFFSSCLLHEPRYCLGQPSENPVVVLTNSLIV